MLADGTRVCGINIISNNPYEILLVMIIILMLAAYNINTGWPIMHQILMGFLIELQPIFHKQTELSNYK